MSRTHGELRKLFETWHMLCVSPASLSEAQERRHSWWARAQGLVIEIRPRQSLGTICEDAPSLLASRKLVISRRARILTTGLFTGRASRELSIALFTAVR